MGVGRYQRNKGAAFERKMAEHFRGIFPDARRGIGQARQASEVPDVEMGPFWTECKVGAQPNIRGALRQAQEACGDRPLWPIAVVHDDRGTTTVTMSLDDFTDLVREWRERGEVK